MTRMFKIFFMDKEKKIHETIISEVNYDEAYRYFRLKYQNYFLWKIIEVTESE